MWSCHFFTAVVILLLHVVYARCPPFAKHDYADAQGDCSCPDDRPTCFQNKQSWCIRSDGNRDFHYFSEGCQNCECHDTEAKGGGGVSVMLSTQKCTAQNAEAQTPSIFGVCTCPLGFPLCVRPGVVTKNGCFLDNGVLSESQFMVNCTNCACRKACPGFAARPFVDSFGDCSCPLELPLCYQDGVPGCVASRRSGGVGLSNTFFKEDCKNCECRLYEGQCDPDFCRFDDDCQFSTCRDCSMCIGITRCPAIGVAEEFPNNGNCKCEDKKSCSQDGDLGCVTLFLGRSDKYFAATCTTCECKDTVGGMDLVTEDWCPEFAEEPKPDTYGDCACPLEKSDCWEGGQPTCKRSDGQNEVRYFSALCTDCECREPLPETRNFSRVKPCPKYAAQPQSDTYWNCVCPLEKPLCVRGDLLAEPDGLTYGTNGSCNTTHGWASISYFRYDCEDCSCMYNEGEGDRKIVIRDEQRLVVTALGSEKVFVKQSIDVDLNLVNPLNMIQNVTRLKETTEAAVRPFARAIAKGVSHVGHVPAVSIEQMKINMERQYTNDDIEDVLTWRIRVDFGLIWAQDDAKDTVVNVEVSGNSTNESSSSDDASTSSYLDGVALIGQDEGGFGLDLQLIDKLTTDQTNLLLNLAAVFQERAFASELEELLWRYFKEVWKEAMEEGITEVKRIQALIDEKNGVVEEEKQVAAATLLGTEDGIDGSGDAADTEDDEYAQFRAPRPNVVRIFLNEDLQFVLLVKLEWTGPVNREAPERFAVPKEPEAEVIEEETPLWVYLAIAGGCLGFCCCCCCGWLAKIKWKERKARKAQEALQAQGLDADALQASTAPGSPGGSSPLNSPGKNPDGSPRSPGSPGSPNASPGRFGSVRGSMSPGQRGSMFGSPGGRMSMGFTPGRMSVSQTIGASARMSMNMGEGSASPSPQGKAKKEITLADKKKKGDLAGHKKLSRAARYALEAEAKKNRKSIFGGKKKSRSDGDGSPREGSEDGSPREGEDGSPRSPREKEGAKEETEKKQGRFGRLFRKKSQKEELEATTKKGKFGGGGGLAAAMAKRAQNAKDKAKAAHEKKKQDAKDRKKAKKGKEGGEGGDSGADQV